MFAQANQRISTTETPKIISKEMDRSLDLCLYITDTQFIFFIIMTPNAL